MVNETERRFKTPLIERFFETPYTYFFLTILLLLLVLPLSDKFEEVLPVVQILLFAVMMLSLWAARVHGIIFLLFLSLAVLTLLTDIWISIEIGGMHKHPSNLARLAITMVHGSFIVTAVVIFIRNIFREKNVTTDTILGGIAVYFLIGILWALFYRAAILINPHSLSIAVAQSHHYVTDLLYFSFSTLTTLGYGDIVAETAFTKNLAVLEGALGQIYLAVFVARLVGLHLSTRQN